MIQQIAVYSKNGKQYSIWTDIKSDIAHLIYKMLYTGARRNSRILVKRNISIC
jgi:hypothetical protein